MDVRLLQLDALHWLWAVAAAAVLVAWSLRWRVHALRRFADTGLLARLAPVSVARSVMRGVLVIAAMVAIVAALLDPRWGRSFRPVQQQGIDLMVVLDASRSMLAEDCSPNRLERARQFIGDMVDRVAGDRVGLVAFAGTATVKCPLTVDYGAFRLALETVAPEGVPRGGSLLGDALRVAADAFTDDLPDYKAIIVFSDGEDHGSYPLEAARNIAAERSIPIYTVGLGDRATGARIPVRAAGGRLYLTHQGQEVWSKMDAEALRAIALESGGAFVPAGTDAADFARIYDDLIGPATRREFDTTQTVRYHARYQWFAGLALLLLVAESLIGERRPRPSLPETAT